MANTGICKSVLSADTIVLRGISGQSSERLLRLKGLTAPRAGNRDRADEPFAFESREFVRGLLVGKQINFDVHTTSTSSPPLEFGAVTLPDGAGDLALAIVKAGWASVREIQSKSNGNEPTEEAVRRTALLETMEGAKQAKLGIWGTEKPKMIAYSMPEDPVEFLAKHKGVHMEAIIEACPNGSTVRCRLLMKGGVHQFINLGLAGVRAPRSASPSGDAGEEFGDEAKFFLEARILQRQLKVTLLSLPSTPTQFGTNQSLASAPTLFLGTIAHPRGNIATFLLAEGLAKVVDWHAGFLSAIPGAMVELRTAESTAKAARKGVWKDLPIPSAGAVAKAKEMEKERKWDGVVTRVWGADMLSVLPVGSNVERKLQLSSIRQPRPTDTKFAGLQIEGKELMRKKLIGKTVHVSIDYIKPAEDQYESRECATIRLANGTNVAELLAEKGYVSVIRHRQGDESRSSEYDKLLAAEASALAATRGVHGTKDYPAPRIIDASESSQKAAPFLSAFKRAGRSAAVVDFVAAGSRFKVIVPKESAKLTLVLSGIRCPRTARNANEKSEPYGVEAAVFASRKLFQRDVEVIISDVDRSGGFIGKMFVNGEDVAVMLCREGLAKTDEYSATKELTDAENEAKQAKKNIWAEYDADAEAVANGAKPVEAVVARKEYVDIVISDIRGGTSRGGIEMPFSFAVQILRNGGIPELETLMSDLTIHNADPKNDIAGFVPRTNDIVAAQFSADNTWYRGRIRRCNPARKEAEVYYMDYGNSEIVPFSRIRSLPQNFKALDGQSKEAALSFVLLLGSETEYGAEALERFKDLCEGRQLVANIDHRESNLLHLSLFDPSNSTTSISPESSINLLLVSEGLARIDKRSKLRDAAPRAAMEAALVQAKRSRAGAYELGDYLDLDDKLSH